MSISRRSFLKGLAGVIATGVAPAIIAKPGILMPVKKIVVPPTVWLPCDGSAYLKEDLFWKPELRRIIPGTISEELIGVQPLSKPFTLPIFKAMYLRQYVN